MEKNRTAPQLEQTGSDKRRPIHEVKMPFNGGLLLASIWRNNGKDGHPWYSVSLSHGRKSADGKWVYGGNFTRDDLLGLFRVIEVAHGHIVSGIFEKGENYE